MGVSDGTVYRLNNFPMLGVNALGLQSTLRVLIYRSSLLHSPRVVGEHSTATQCFFFRLFWGNEELDAKVLGVLTI